MHERRILEHRLRDLAAVALALDVALEVLDAPLLPVHGVAQLHRGGGLLGQPLTAVGILELGNGALAFLQYFQALVELHLQFLQDALTLLEDPMLDRLFLDASQRSAQAAARAGLGGLLEAVLETAVMGFVCDGASLVSRLPIDRRVRSLRGSVSCRGSRVAAWRNARGAGSPVRLTFARAGTTTTAVWPRNAGQHDAISAVTVSG